MAILPRNVAQQVQEMFQSLESPVELVLVDEGGDSELDQLMRELGEFSPLLSYRRAPAHEARSLGVEEELLPAVLMNGPKGYARARFIGAPAGHEFGVLIQDIIDISQEKIELSQATKDYLESLQHDVKLQVFTTPT